MNKFLAMLKDSYREAIDGWIFTVMLILSGVLTLLLASISYTPTRTEDAVVKMIPPLQNIQAPPPLQTVSSDRGRGTDVHIYGFNAYVRDVVVESRGKNPWEDGLKFRLDITAAGFGEIELDADKKPKGGNLNLLGDSFKDAVRTWAKPAGGERPKYTDELAVEFLTSQIANATRMNITGVEKVKGQNGVSFTIAATGASTPLAWPHKPSLFFGAVPMSFLESPLGRLVYFIENILVNTIGAWFVLMAGVIVTAGFVPNMLRKGAIDLLLTKPLSRPAILIFKYLGGLFFVLALTVVAYGGVWLAIGLRAGVWAPGILYCIPCMTFYFAVLYAFSTLFGVLTRNALVSILVTVLFWFVIFMIGYIHMGLTLFDGRQNEAARRPAARQKVEDKKAADNADEDAEAEPDDAGKPPRTLVEVFKVLNNLTPRTKDLDTLTSTLVSRDLLSEGEQREQLLKMKSLAWGEVLGVAGAYIAVFLGLALLRFVTRSY